MIFHANINIQIQKGGWMGGWVLETNQTWLKNALLSLNRWNSGKVCLQEEIYHSQDLKKKKKLLSQMLVF